MTARDRLAALLCQGRRDRMASDHMADWMQHESELNRPCFGCREDADALLASGEVLVVSDLTKRDMGLMGYGAEDAQVALDQLAEFATRQAGGAPEEAREG